MYSMLYAIIGFITATTLKSGGISMDMWQFWVVVVCLVAAIIITVIYK